MAESPEIRLRYEGDCPDCGVREAFLPPELPDAGDDTYRVGNGEAAVQIVELDLAIDGCGAGAWCDVRVRYGSIALAFPRRTGP